jgi:hypothetical protein
MPMGAVIFIDFWVLKKIGLKNNYAELSGESFNWAAALTWGGTVAFCFYLRDVVGVHEFFVSLPGWFVAAILYMVISKIYQKKITVS